MTPPVSPTFTGPLPELTVNLEICEIGDPCRPPRLEPSPGYVPYVCRIHRIRAFFQALGWLAR
jgi:hypothetical protein